MSKMGRKPKYTNEQASELFVRATKRYGHVPNTREFAKFAKVSTATAWIIMTHLKLRKACEECQGTGWAQS